MKKIKCIYLVVAVITLLSSCAVIRPGEVYNTPQNLDTRIVIRKRKFIFAAKSD